jgi:hypothetical protein
MRPRNSRNNTIRPRNSRNTPQNLDDHQLCMIIYQEDNGNALKYRSTNFGRSVTKSYGEGGWGVLACVYTSLQTTHQHRITLCLFGNSAYRSRCLRIVPARLLDQCLMMKYSSLRFYFMGPPYYLSSGVSCRFTFLLYKRANDELQV